MKKGTPSGRHRILCNPRIAVGKAHTWTQWKRFLYKETKKGNQFNEKVRSQLTRFLRLYQIRNVNGLAFKPAPLSVSNVLLRRRRQFYST